MNSLGAILAIIVLTTASLTDAQQPANVPRIGFVLGVGGPDPRTEAFRQALRDLGYTEGKNILIEYRSAEQNMERSRRLITELIQLNVVALIIGNFAAIQAAKEATKTIPIVMVTQADPVATGLVASLARPGGNITGLTTLSRELGGKRLEILKDVIPKTSRVGVLRDAASETAAAGFKEYETAGRALKLSLQSLEVVDPNSDWEGLFQSAAQARVNALILIRSVILSRHVKRITELAIKNRMPSMCERYEYVDAGCLMSYSANDADQFRRAAYYVDRILKGAKPADLPVEQPTKFEFVINLKTAKQINVTIPQWTLTKADRVIK